MDNNDVNKNIDMKGETMEVCLVNPPNEGKRDKLWKNVKYQLVEYHSLPGFLRDNEYRSEWPMKQILLSIFKIHNETLNVWTHLIGFFIFLSLTIYTAMKIPKVVDLDSLQQIPDAFRNADLHKWKSEILPCLPSVPNIPDLQKLQAGLKSSLPLMDLIPSLSSWRVMEHLYDCLPELFTPGDLQSVKEPITRWPFFAFLGGAMFCLLASSTCHLLSCHSERLSYIMLRLDYAGIAALISTSFYPLVYYSFMCDPFFCNLYLVTITILGIATILFSLLPVFQKPEFRTIRASLFFGMGISAVAPILHKLVLFRNQPVALQTTLYEILMGLLYSVGALVYAARVPERWMPGYV